MWVGCKLLRIIIAHQINTYVNLFMSLLEPFIVNYQSFYYP